LKITLSDRYFSFFLPDNLFENCFTDNMEIPFDIEERLAELFGPEEMALESNRLSSFVSWPYTSEDTCNKENLAKAGFFSDPTTSSGDCVKCFFCLKSLQDWDRDDNPWDEHLRLTIRKGTSCPFMELGKVEEDLTVGEFFILTKKRLDIVFAKLEEEMQEKLNK
ncbi:Baculoviral IAP repeat-containing protein 5.2, partial [Trichinella spiralis]